MCRILAIEYLRLYRRANSTRPRSADFPQIGVPPLVRALTGHADVRDPLVDERREDTPVQRLPDEDVGGVVNELAQDAHPLLERDRREVAVDQGIDFRIRIPGVVSAVEGGANPSVAAEERAHAVGRRADAGLNREALEVRAVLEIALALLGHDLLLGCDANGFPEVEDSDLRLGVGVVLGGHYVHGE